MSGATEVPSIGRVKLSWVNNPSNTTSTSTTGTNPNMTSSPAAAPSSPYGSGDPPRMSNSAANNHHDARGTPMNEDYDVADDNDRWMAG